MSQAPSTFGSMMTSSFCPIADDFANVVEHPWRIERIDAGPQSGFAELATLRHGDKAISCGRLAVGGDRVLQIAEHDVDLGHQFRHFGAHFLDMWGHEMNHALEP